MVPGVTISKTIILRWTNKLLSQKDSKEEKEAIELTLFAYIFNNML